MSRRLLLSLTAAALVAACRPSAPEMDVIIDHDGGVDDLIAMTLLLQSPGVRVHAITVCPADSYLDPALRATRMFVERLGAGPITIAGGTAEGRNPFPDAWRRDAARVLTIPALAGGAATASPPGAGDAAHVIARLLSGDRTFTILETGPLTNVAAALALNPRGAKNITRIYAMGGAVRVAGNVHYPGHDGSAEWNVFNEPLAAAAVFRAGVPVTLVPLDATNHVPLTRRFLDRLGAQTSVASQLAAQAWTLAEQSGASYFWDTLTAAVLLDGSLVTTARLPLRVVTSGASQGRTVEDPGGVPVDVALDARQERVEAMFLELLGR